MQLGFNTNFRHRDVVFHVQTEDSGRANPHVITHVFHGGNIIASLKSDYSDLLEEADFDGAVRKLMESQHKSMLKQLSRGELDRAIRERLGAGVFAGDAGSAATDRTPGLDGKARTPAQSPRAASSTSASSESAPSSPSSSAAAGAATTVANPGSKRPVASPRSTTDRMAAKTAEPTVVTPDKRDSSSGLARVFGERVVSEKPLDEVVLEYLVENARKRKRQPKP